MQKPILEQTKTCLVCKKIKPLSSFSMNRRKRSGVQYKCKECVSEYNKLNRAELRAKKIDYLQTEKGIDVMKKASMKHRHTSAFKETQKRYCSLNPHKIASQRALRYAVRVGKIKRPDTCSSCGVRCFPEGHHWSYAKDHQLDVIWLCKKCHEETHKIQKVEVTQ